MIRIREVILAAEIIGCAALFGTGLYESMVLAPNFIAGIPSSLEHARLFWSAANPGTFFRVISPIVQLLALASVILSWRRPAGRRTWLIAAFLLGISADVITFTFHYPRNRLLFTDPLGTQPDILLKAAQEWAIGNYFRVGVALLATIAALVAFSKREPIARYDAAG